jgi:hypothetical protein
LPYVLHLTVNLSRIYHTTTIRGDKYGNHCIFPSRIHWDFAVKEVYELPDEKEGDEEGVNPGAHHIDADKEARSDKAGSDKAGNDDDDRTDGDNRHTDGDDEDYDPRTYVVSILNGWLGHFYDYPGHRTLVGEWEPNKYGWQLEDNRSYI